MAVSFKLMRPLGLFLGLAVGTSLCAADADGDHWSFRPIGNAESPLTKRRGWARNAIDLHVLARLEEAGIEPSPTADRRTLIRRLTLDLLGLLPAPHDVEAFVEDRRPGAYDRLVERLLASPRFGERWGRYWLDLARYADSDGYEKDRVRPHAWRYRDWVIEAFNRDLPFDAFTLEQLAGDLLPTATLEQRIATGFHRNTLTNTEGGVDQEEYRVKAVVDRVNTTGSVWLGLTVGCAQCHSHKYDPLTQRDYYQLFAFFNSQDEVNIPAPFPEQQEAYRRAKAKFDLEHAELELALREREGRVGAEWARRSGEPPRWVNLTPASWASGGGGRLEKLEDGSLLATGESARTDVYTLVFNTPLTPITALRLEALTHPSLPQEGPGRAANGNFVLSELSVTAAELGDPGTAKQVEFVKASADFAQTGFAVSAAIDGKDGKDDRGWAVQGKKKGRRVAVFELAQPLVIQGGATLVVRLAQNHGDRHVLGRLRLAATSSVELLHEPEAIQRILAVDPGKRTDAQKRELAKHYRIQDAEWRKLKKAVDEHAKKAPRLGDMKAQVLVERSQPRKTHLLVRGDFLRKGTVVAPDVPAVLPPLPPGADNPSRIDLARWLVSLENPLTARVAVNRVWQQLFGRGLVASEDDFGARGEKPSHPELLDWLAREYARRRWSRKDLIRLIVKSATYRQASDTRAGVSEQDPRNLALARQNRFRLEAELLRDISLAAAGLLTHRIGGPSVRPPLPAGVAALGYAGSVRWPESRGADRYRRGLYIFFQRTVPYPMLTTFDAPDSTVSCTRRERSNTPLQSLTLLNDPVFFECAQGLGRRLVREVEGGVSERVDFGFRICVGRGPDAEELSRLTRLHAELLELCRADPAAAAKMTGENVGPETSELAAWIGIARVLLNLDEFVTRG